MKQTRRFFLGATAAFAIAVLAGCNGGSSNGPTQLFAGTYTGSYAGTAADGSATAGRFTVTAFNNGQVTGNLIAPNGNTLPVTGTINTAGDLRFATAAGANVISVATSLAAIDGTYVGDGTFSQTVNNVQNASSGRATAIRQRTQANQFAGNYTGTFTSTNPAGTQGTLNVTANVDGSIAGTMNITGTATVFRVTGVVTPAGDVTLYGVGDRGGAPRIQFVTKFNGDGTINNNIATITGTFATAEAGVTTVEGNFTLTEQPV